MRRLEKIITTIVLACSELGFSGVYTDDLATRCSHSNYSDDGCGKFLTHPWLGRYELTLGLDSSLAFRFAGNDSINFVDAASSETLRLENQGSIDLRFGVSSRVELFESIGIAATVGYASTSMSARPDTGIYSADSADDPFSISCTGTYLEGALYYPVQRINTVGLSAGFRRFSVDHIEFRNDLDIGPSAGTLASPPVELFLSSFVGPFYFGITSRSEKWKQSPGVAQPIDNSGIGLELGLSGPLTRLFPR